MFRWIHRTLCKTHRHRSTQGYSLVETMVAMGVLGIGLLAVAQIVPAANRGLTQAQMRTNAVEAAQSRVDALRTMPYDAAGLTAGTYTESDGSYTLSWTITDNLPVVGTKRVIMQASWTAPNGIRSANLITYITEGT